MKNIFRKMGFFLILGLFLVGGGVISCSEKVGEGKDGSPSRVHPKSSQDPTREMVKIPAGPFLMGSNEKDDEGIGSEFGTVKPLYRDEHPLHRIFLKSFWIDKYEVNNLHYKQFVESTKSRSPKSWPEGKFPIPFAHYPVTFVSWYDAKRFCEWAGKRLPKEAEWEKAARGTDGRLYPWGNEFDPKRANTGESMQEGVAPVGSYEMGISPFGVYDMVGNVWEWVDDWYKPYPSNTYNSEAFGEKNKVLKGGSWGGTGHYALSVFYRIPYRLFSPPEEAYPDGGLRCAKDA